MQAKAKRALLLFLFIMALGMKAAAQPSLEYFTNQANAALQSQFGFGVTNIPVYCPANPAIGYTAAIHYVLQGIANAWDATTPATNLPSVFRPELGWVSNTLYITNYAAMTNDGWIQVQRAFKSPKDSSIAGSDNVLGIPWVVGDKGKLPAFNEYCHATRIDYQRDLEFLRRISQPGQYVTDKPPEFTNQFCMFSISNAFGVEVWNPYPTTFTNDVSIFIFDCISTTFTNNYDFGTDTFYTNLSVQEISNRPGYFAGRGFVIPLMTNLTMLPWSYWSESIRGLVPLNDFPNFLASDTNQMFWPEHSWTFTVTNNLIYALVDNASGSVLDFVNLANFGSAIDLQSVLDPEGYDSTNLWIIPPAFDGSNSPVSSGMINQIHDGMAQSLIFADSLLGQAGGYPAAISAFWDPANASASFIQSCTWSAANPKLHYTVADLTSQQSAPQLTFLNFSQQTRPLSLDSGNCTLGQINLNYNPGSVTNSSVEYFSNTFGLQFNGLADLPYSIWASSNLLDWNQIGTASQPCPGSFQFQDTAVTKYPQRFYQVRVP